MYDVSKKCTLNFFATITSHQKGIFFPLFADYKDLKDWVSGQIFNEGKKCFKLSSI